MTNSVSVALKRVETALGVHNLFQSMDGQQKIQFCQTGLKVFPSLSVQNTNLMDYVPDVYISTTNSQTQRCGIWFVKGMLKGMEMGTVWVIEISIRL